MNQTDSRAADLGTLRREFRSQPLRRADLDPDPVGQFGRWLGEARNAGTLDPNAMSVATVAADGQPSLRTVLLKSYDADGFVFYTNLDSRKSVEISRNSRVALLFYWGDIGRQVKIGGAATRTSAAENRRYFATRPKDSQIGAWVSAQSSRIAARSVLESRFAELERQFADGEVPLPSFWGGYRVVPAAIEFWQARANRLHDRFLYTRSGAVWTIDRLAP